VTPADTPARNLAGISEADGRRHRNGQAPDKRRRSMTDEEYRQCNLDCLCSWIDEVEARLMAGGLLDQETARALAVRASVEHLDEDFGPLPEAAS
jgi:hypothetical protein